MVGSHDARDRSAPREEQDDDRSEGSSRGESGTASEISDRAADSELERQTRLRWVQLREPKHALEIGRNGRVLDSFYHEGYDAWEVLLETYEGEL
jgi:hypothetical protein